MGLSSSGRRKGDSPSYFCLGEKRAQQSQSRCLGLLAQEPISKPSLFHPTVAVRAAPLSVLGPMQ